MSETPSSSAHSLPPVGTLLIVLNQFAESLGLSAECDEYLRSGIPISTAYDTIMQVMQNSASGIGSDCNEYIMSCATENGNSDLYTRGSLNNLVLTRSSTSHWISEAATRSSIVQVLQLIDEFCDRFGVTSLGEKELKYAVPCDSAVHVLACLAFDPSFLRSDRKDWIIVGRCRRVRHERKIDVTRDPFAGMVPVDRTCDLTCEFQTSASASASASSLPSLIEDAEPFTETFPLHIDSVLKHSGPKLVLALSAGAVNGLVSRWLRQFPRIDKDKFWKMYPFDCLVRGIKGSPNALDQTEWLIKESIRTAGRYRFCSLSELDRKVDEVCRENSLSSDIRNFLTNKISISYCYLIVFGKIDRKDSKALSLGAKWISLGRLRLFETRSRSPTREFLEI